MFYYLLANCFSAFSNNLCKYLTIDGNSLGGEKPLTIILHTDILNLFLFSFIYFYFKYKGKVDFTLKETFCTKEEVVQILLFSIPVFASSYKLLLMENIHLSSLEIAAMIKPFLVCIFATFLLKEKFKLYYLYYGFFICLGFMISNYNKISIDHIFWLLSFILIASVGDTTRRYYCVKKKNPLQGWCVEFFIFFLYGFVILLVCPLLNYIFPTIFYGLGKYKFSFDIFFNPFTWLISLITLSHHLSAIYGVKRASSVTSLEFINFSKVIFTLIFSYIFLGDVPYCSKVCLFGFCFNFYNQIFGAFVISITLLFFSLRVKRDKLCQVKNNT